ncbi:MAG: ArsC/Spx/MgsR family protein [Gammaproteobacteria bacterium]
MARIIFYEKPGCINNTRQKKLLQLAGHTVIAKNLLTEDWADQSERLQEFFSGKAISEWFNRSAPAIKNGLVDPKAVTGQQAIALMLSDPLLIRRPLMQVGDEKTAGFDEQFLEYLIGLNNMQSETDIETCPRARQTSCEND